MGGAKDNGPIRPAPGDGLGLARLHQAQTVRRARQRALADAALLVLLIAAAMLFARNADEAFVFGLLTASAGIIVFLYRRGRDLDALSRADGWRSDAIEGRGLSLADWRSGAPLPGWKDRRDIA